MGIFKKSVYGLYLGLAFLGVVFCMDSALPGMLAASAFSPVAIIALFSLLIFEAIFGLH